MEFVTLTTGVTNLAGSPSSASTMIVVRVPLAPPTSTLVANLLAVPPSARPTYIARLAALLDARGLFSRVDVELFMDAVTVPPVVQIANGMATVTVIASTFGTPPGWETTDSTQLTLPPVRVPQDVQLTVRLNLRGTHVTSLRPLPDAESSDQHLEWSFGPGSTATVAVTVPSALNGGFDAGRAISELLLAVSLPFWVLFGAGPYRGRLSARRLQVKTAADWALHRLSMVALVLALCAAASLALDDVNVQTLGISLGLDSPGQEVLAFLAPVAFPTLGLIAFMVLAGTDRPRRWRRGTAAAFVVTAFVGALAAATAVQAAAFGDVTLWPYEAAAVCLAVAVIAFAVGSCCRWLCRVAPPIDAWWRGRGRRARIVGFGCAGLLTLTVSGQLLLAAHAELHPSHRPFAPPVGVSWAQLLLDELGVVAPNLAGLALASLDPILGLGLGYLLWRALEDSPELSLRDPSLRIMLALLFGSVVVGTTGTIAGYAAPLAFVLTLGGVVLGLRTMAASRRSGLLSDVTVREAASGLLADSARITIARRRLDNLRDDYTAGKLDEPGYVDARARIEEQIGELSRAPVVAGKVPERRLAAEARALGFAAGVGARARLGLAFRGAWWVIAIPMGYTVYVVVERTYSFAFSAAAPLGLLNLLVAVMSQALLWPLAVWCFVLVAPCLPTSIGPTKALIAAAAFVVPSAVVAPFLGHQPGGATGWAFLASELALLFIVVGVLLDYRAVARSGMRLRELGELYSITTVRAALAYAVPLAVLLVTVAQELASGSASSAVGELAKNATSLVPPVH